MAVGSQSRQISSHAALKFAQGNLDAYNLAGALLNGAASFSMWSEDDVIIEQGV